MATGLNTPKFAFNVAGHALIGASGGSCEWGPLLGAARPMVATAEKEVQGARNGHSDKEKFRSDLNRPKGCEISERLLKTLQKFGDFQAEYEGSIPFTRSKAISMA